MHARTTAAPGTVASGRTIAAPGRQGSVLTTAAAREVYLIPGAGAARASAEKVASMHPSSDAARASADVLNFHARGVASRVAGKHASRCRIHSR